MSKTGSFTPETARVIDVADQSLDSLDGFSTKDEPEQDTLAQVKGAESLRYVLGSREDKSTC